MAPKSKKTFYVLSSNAFNLTRKSEAVTLMEPLPLTYWSEDHLSTNALARLVSFSFFLNFLWSSILICFWTCKCLGFVVGWVYMKTWHFRRGRNMFRMSFGWDMVGNVKEHFSIWVHAYEDLGLLTQLMFKCMHPFFMCTWAYSWEYVYMGFN